MSREKAGQVFNIDVAWGDSDIFGHTNNVQFIRYLESARVAYCEDVMGLPLEVGMSAGWVLADMQCSYLQQVHYPTHLEVYSRISKIGSKSVTLMANIFRKGEDEPVACSKAVMVWFDFDTNKSA
ncbi:MAG: acyl-CoA thioesterase, partial [Cycloclasticus sp.]|nr:acyl-CoA thioesterase [Cycloclasticus sp.]